MSRQAIPRHLALFSRWVGSEIRLQWVPGFFRRNPRAEIFVVGGAVRDILLGRAGRKDLDLVIRNVPLRTLERELRHLGKVNLVGRVFGVLKFIPRGSSAELPLDIALPRTDFAAGTGGYKDVHVHARATMKIEDDLSRRDFTVNAMAWNLAEGRLVDPHHGMDDLNRRVLRAVGDPSSRFKEDYSRMLRAIRFATQLSFTIEPKTWRAIKINIRHLNDRSPTFPPPSRKGEEKGGGWVVPRETIAKELLKSFAVEPVQALDFLDESGALRLLLPEVHAMKGCPQPTQFHTEGDVYDHTRLALGVLASKKFAKEFSEGWNTETALGVLFHDIGKPVTLKTPEEHGVDRIRTDEHDTTGAEMTLAIVHRLALSSYREPPAIDVDAERLAFLVRRHLFTVHGHIAEIRRTTLEKVFFNPNVPGRELLQVIFADCSATISPKKQPTLGHFKELRKRLSDLERLAKAKPTLPAALLDGDDIMRMLKIKPGMRVGEVKTALREAQLRGKVKTKQHAILFIQSLRGTK